MSGPSESWQLPLPQPRRGTSRLSSVSSLVTLALACLLILFVPLIPLAALLWQAVPELLSGMWQSPTVVAALRLSLFSSTLATLLVVLLGSPVAYILARYRFRGVRLLDILIDLPMVLPPAVAGIALLVAFGRNGVPGRYLAGVGIEIPFTTAAVIMAQMFVSAPFYVRAAKAGFAGVDQRLEQISATLGESDAGTFWRITLPLARNALLAGAIMTWSRSLGEFGATILFAGNLPDRTQTMPLAIYTALQTDINVALALAAILLGISFLLLVLLRIVTG